MDCSLEPQATKFQVPRSQEGKSIFASIIVIFIVIIIIAIAITIAITISIIPDAGWKSSFLQQVLP